MKLPESKKILCPICPMLLKLLKWGYLLLHYFIIVAIFLFSLLIFLAFRDDALDIAHKYILNPMGISYKTASGSLAKGFKLYNINHKNFQIESLESKYDLADIIMGDHRVKSLELDGLYINLDDFSSDSDDELVWRFGKFYFDSVIINNLQLVSGVNTIEIDISAKNGVYDGKNIDIAIIKTDIKTEFVIANVIANVSKNRLKAQGESILLSSILKHSDEFVKLPKKLSFSADGIIDKNININTKIKNLSLVMDEVTHIDDIEISSSFRYSDNFINVDTTYNIIRDEIAVKSTQNIKYNFDGFIESKILANLELPYDIPNKNIELDIFSDFKKFSLTGSGLNSDISIISDDLEHFKWDIKSRFENLSFFNDMPVILSDSNLFIDSNGYFSKEAVDGKFNLKHKHIDIIGEIKNIDDRYKISGIANTDLASPNQYKEIDFALFLNKDDMKLNINSQRLALMATLKDREIVGSGNYSGVYFDIFGDLSRVQIDAFAPSLFDTIKDFQDINLTSTEYYDAEARAKISVDMDEALFINATVSIPWYALVQDSQNSFSGTDSTLNISYSDNRLDINSYDINILNHKIGSNKTSTILLQDDFIDIKEFWIYDDLLANGLINSDNTIDIAIKSPKFRYKGIEGEVASKVDIDFKRDINGRYSLVGDIDILEAKIVYLPLQEYRIKDDDIIIIQDVKAPSDINFFVNLHIESKKPLVYKTDNINLEIIPDVTFWKEYRGDIELLGMTTITKGFASAANKEFDIEKSFIHFDGSNPINPYLDLTIRHEVDYNKFKIYVTHRLDSPMFLFSSDPMMSQNDIMSYILFGTPASDVGGGDGEIRADMSHLVMGAGLKGLINSMTKLKIDRMNILTTTEGGLGFEVGARLSKDLRVLYKNDAVSSVLLQYAINRWLRLDIDVKENSQGINIIYIKDFIDFLKK